MFFSIYIMYYLLLIGIYVWKLSNFQE
jgi:hypothetical protein